MGARTLDRSFAVEASTSRAARAAAALALLLAGGGCGSRDPSARLDGGGGEGGPGNGGAGGQGGATGCGATAAFDTWMDPEILCAWSGGNVMTTPLVVDLDGDGKPEIVFQTMDPAGGGSCHSSGVRLHALRGADCTEVWSVDAQIGGCVQLAAGDLDGDGRPEIVGYDNAAQVVRVFTAAGALLAESDPMNEWNTTWGDGSGSGPTIADVDGKPPAEIVMGGVALRFAGSLRLEVLWAHEVPEGLWGSLSLVADVDLDGKPDVVSGNRIFDGASGTDKTPAPLAAQDGGYPAVAQIDPSTRQPEIVLVSSQNDHGALSVIDPLDGTIRLGPFAVPPGPVQHGVGGAPVVADFDGDTLPEIGVAGPTEYDVFDPECAATPMPAKCAAPGVLWSSATRDASSGGTSSSVFDFNSDCQAEVVYRDECWLRIYEGRSGKVLAAFAVTSGTALEEPVIADVDGDGHAELLVSSDDVQAALPDYACPAESHTGKPFPEYTKGVIVLRDPMRRWAPARRIWNQNTYHVTNVNEDGTIPIPEASSWDLYNSYRQNVAP